MIAWEATARHARPEPVLGFGPVRARALSIFRRAQEKASRKSDAGRVRGIRSTDFCAETAHSILRSAAVFGRIKVLAHSDGVARALLEATEMNKGFWPTAFPSAPNAALPYASPKVARLFRPRNSSQDWRRHGSGTPTYSASWLARSPRCFGRQLRRGILLVSFGSFRRRVQTGFVREGDVKQSRFTGKHSR